MTVKQEPSPNTGIRPSKTLGCPCSTATPPPVTWLRTVPIHTLQATRELNSRSPKSRDESILSERSSHRAIQQNSTHPMPPSKETNSWNTTTNKPPMGHNRSGNWDLSNHQYRVRVDGSGRIPLRNHRFLRKLETPTIPFPIPSAVTETSTPNSTPHRPNTPVPQTMGTSVPFTLTHPPLRHCPDYSHTTRQVWRNSFLPKDHYPRAMGRGNEEEE